MNKFNPLLLLLLTICLFLYSIIDIKSSNEYLKKVSKQNKQFVEIATKYNMLQQAWGKGSTTKKQCEKFLKLSNIKNAKIVANRKTIKIKIENASLKSIDKFMNKILNNTIEILNFSFTKDTLNLEIGI